MALDVQAKFRQWQEIFIQARLAYLEKHSDSPNTLAQDQTNILTALTYLHAQRNEPANLRRFVQAVISFYPALDSIGDYITAEHLLTLAREKAITLQDEIAQATIYHALGLFAARRGNHSTATKYHKATLTLARKYNDLKMLSRAVQGLGVQAASTGDLSNAEKHFRRALNIAHQIQYVEGVTSILSNLGSTVARRGNLELARQYFEQGLTSPSNKVDDLVTLRINLGVLSGYMKDYEQAEQHLQDALALAKKHQHLELQTRVLLNLSAIMINQKQYTKAKRLLNQGLVKAYKLGHPEIIIDMLANYASLTSNLNTRSASKQTQDFLQQALDTAQKYNYKQKECDLQIRWGQYWYSQRVPEEGTKAFNQAIELATALDNAPLLKYATDEKAKHQEPNDHTRKNQQMKLTIKPEK